MIQHKKLADGQWQRMRFCEQMANVGSEVSRALNWQAKHKQELSLKAADRALELMDLSLASAASYPQRRELTRLREALVDFFYGTNQFGSSEKLWRKYFDGFNYLARRDT